MNHPVYGDTQEDAIHPGSSPGHDDEAISKQLNICLVMNKYYMLSTEDSNKYHTLCYKILKFLQSNVRLF